jgi:flagellar basal body-associated protein FliL
MDWKSLVDPHAWECRLKGSWAIIISSTIVAILMAGMFYMAHQHQKEVGLVQSELVLRAEEHQEQVRELLRLQEEASKAATAHKQQVTSLGTIDKEIRTRLEVTPADTLTALTETKEVLNAISSKLDKLIEAENRRTPGK